MNKQAAIGQLEIIVAWLKSLNTDVLQGELLKDLIDRLVDVVAQCQANYYLEVRRQKNQSNAAPPPSAPKVRTGTYKNSGTVHNKNAALAQHRTRSPRHGTPSGTPGAIRFYPGLGTTSIPHPLQHPPFIIKS